jgi:hypothetical protein
MEEIKVSYDNLLVYKKGYTSDKVHNLIKINKLNGLRIFSELRNDRLEDVNFLRDYTFLEHLEITSINDFNFDFLNKLDNLKKLSINVTGTNEIDLSHQTRLEYLSIQWRKGIKGLDNCTSLSSLGVSEFKERDLVKLTNLKSLIDLRIKTASIESLDGLNGLVNLQNLLIANCKKLTSVKSINQLPKLQHLDFDTCPNVKDYDHLTNLQSLQSLSMINCGKIESIKFIENYPLLSKLSLLGNTIISDGNLLPAKRLSSVEHKHYDHYNIKLENQTYEQTVKDNLQKIKNLKKK